MRKVEIEIETVNAAFGETELEQAQEVARILRELADKLDKGGAPYILKDANGNKVGTMKVE